jgi:hypothetical protein
MNTYLRNLIGYFENVLHPASGWSSDNNDKRKRRTKKETGSRVSPDGYNIRGGIVKKQDKLRRNPAP